MKVPLALGFLCLATLLPAAGPPDGLEAEILRLSDQVGEIAGRERGLLDQADLLRRRIRLDEAVIRRAEAESQALKARRAEALRAEEEAAGRQRRAEAYLKVRVRQQYALGLLQEYRLLFTVRSTEDVRTAGLYLGALSRRDAARLKEFQELRRKREATRRNLEALERDLRTRTEEAEREKAALEGEQRRLSELLRRIQGERSAAERSLAERLEAARAMDRYLNDLEFRRRVEVFSRNMGEAEGSLPMPCEGSVVRGFGDYVHPRFKTRVPHPGLDIRAALGAPVRAVFDGTVEYAGWLSGYGYTVILRHPGGFFTVYAHLDQVSVPAGKVVAEGERVGNVGEDAATGTAALYFELRRGGRALDPAPWFAGGSHER